MSMYIFLKLLHDYNGCYFTVKRTELNATFARQFKLVKIKRI